MDIWYLAHMLDEAMAPGQAYLNAFGKKCMEYGMTDAGEILSYYAKKHDEGKLDVEPEELAAQFAREAGIKAAYFKLDDDYFDQFMDWATRFGVSDDYILKYWEDLTKRDDASPFSPRESAEKAVHEFPHTAYAKDKKLSFSDLEKIRQDSAAQAAAEIPRKQPRTI